MKATKKLLMGLTTLGLTLGMSISAFAATTTYSFDDSTAGDAKVYGTATYVDGKVGKALQFNGTDTYLTVPKSVLTEDFTFAAWVKVDELKSWSRFFDFGANKDNAGQFWVGMIDNGVITSELMKDGVRDIRAEAPEKTLKAGEWVHFAYTVNKGTAQIYINGEPITMNFYYTDSNKLGKDAWSKADAAVAFATTPNQIATEDAEMLVGKSHYPDPLFKGVMDEIVFADKAMSAAEIKDAMNGVSAAATDSSAAAATTTETAASNPKTGDPGVIAYAFAAAAAAGTGLFASKKRK